MEPRNQLILNQRRDFGDVIGDGLKFMKINFKPMLNVFLTYVIPTFFLPLLIILALGYLPIFLGAFSLDSADQMDPSAAMGSMMAILSGMLIFMIFAAIGYMLLNLTVFGAFLAYEENGNMEVTAEQIKSKIKEKFSNYLISLLVLFSVMLLLYIATLLVVTISAFLGVAVVFIAFFIAGLAFVWFAINIVNFSWIRIREDVGIGEAFSRAFALTKNDWWSTFGVVFVASLMTTIAGYAFSVPFHMLSSFAGISGLEGPDSASSLVLLAGLGFLVYMVGTAYVQQYLSACTIMKYFDQVEQKDGSSIASQIDQLGDSEERFFENEGEY